MKVAALYDIHGNLPALRAVLADVRAERPALLVVGGDVVAGPMPEETMDELFASGLITRWVMGNADREMLDEEPGPSGGWAVARLRPEQQQLLETFQPTVATGGVLFCHGSPRSDTEVLTPFTPDARVAAACAGVRQRIVVCGHTHRQFDRRAGGHRIVNAGSVGRPYEGDAAAFWLLVADGEPQMRRTAYDIDDAVAAMRATGMPGIDDTFLADSLLAPADPDEVSRHFEPVSG